MALTKESIDAGINQDEDEKCAHLAELSRLAKAAGYTVGSGAPLPELNPDGSYANPEDEAPADNIEGDEGTSMESGE